MSVDSTFFLQYLADKIFNWSPQPHSAQRIDALTSLSLKYTSTLQDTEVEKRFEISIQELCFLDIKDEEDAGHSADWPWVHAIDRGPWSMSPHS